MKVRWKTLMTRLTLWLALEVVLGCLGMDNLADYSEYIFDKKIVLTYLSYV